MDTEFFDTSEEQVVPVCASLTYGDDSENYWTLNNPGGVNNLVWAINHLHEQGYIFVSYSVIAEGRFFLSIGLDPRDFNWIDLYLEYRMLLNQNHSLQYGKQLIKGNKIRTTPPKSKWLQNEDDKKRTSQAKPEYNLGACVYKLLGMTIDSERKTKMRDILISGDIEVIEDHKDEIVEYCDSDVIYLPKILNKQIQHFKSLLPKKELKTLLEEMLFRSNYAARTAVIESLGIPFNRKWTESLGSSIPLIKRTIQEEINDTFPEVTPYRWNKRENRYSVTKANIKKWIRTTPYEKDWLRTDKKDLSLKLDAWVQFFDFKYSFPKDNFGAQMVRIAKTESALRGFAPPTKPGQKTFWSSVGRDDRSRPFLSIYGSQTGRNQPSSTGFIFLKSAWMRSLVEPPSGYAYGAIDFKSQEFLIAGLESHDMNMIKAYNSGDVYMWFAIQAGAAPKGATKETHGDIRDKFKSTVLGMQYGMMAKSLARKLTQDTGVEHSEDDAQDLIDNFYDIFTQYAEWLQETIDLYDEQGYLKTRDGWYMFGDNDNIRSILNFPSQGAGGGILRYSVKRAQDNGLDIPQTLHDALYTLSPLEELADDMDTLRLSMFEGFRDYYKGHPMLKYANVGLDAQAWSPELEDGSFTTPGGLFVPTQRVYVDKRGAEEFKNFSKYFTLLESMEIL